MTEDILNTNKQIFIFGKDKNSKYTFCNEAIAEVAGLDSSKQIIGKMDDDFVWKPQAELFRRGDSLAMQGKVFLNVPEPLTQRTRIATFLNTKTILTDKNGSLRGIIGHAIDITGYTVTKNNGQVDHQKNIFFLGPCFGNAYFTKREFEVFKYLLLGKCVEEIAFTLCRSVKTIQTQIKSIVNKLQCSHKSEIVPTAIQYGLTHVLNEINLIKN